MFVADGTLTLNDSASISGNEAWGAGGGVYDAGGTLSGVICGSSAGANVHGNTPDDCYVFGAPRRIERPDDGVAVTFPAGWDIEVTNDWRTSKDLDDSVDVGHTRILGPLSTRPLGRTGSSPRGSPWLGGLGSLEAPIESPLRAHLHDLRLLRPALVLWRHTR